MRPTRACSLSDLLAKYGLPVDKTTHQKMLRSYIVAEGMDKYWVLYSVTEIEGSEHNGDVIVATSQGESRSVRTGSSSWWTAKIRSLSGGYEISAQLR